ncbi:MAG: DUF4837 family protein [Fermentimonas sp.]|jgi:hypothetical protein
MKQFTGLLFMLAATMVLLTSCNGSSGFFTATGATNEVLVVMDDAEWEAPMGRALFDVLNSNVKAIPQVEPNFRIVHVSPDNYTSTLKMARNIVIPNVSNIYSKPSLSSEIDQYAIGQVILKINAPDSASFTQFVRENKESIVDYIVKKELERQAAWLMETIKSPVVRVQQKFGVNITFPRGLVNFSEADNFFWATNNSPRGREDIVVYQFPYRSESVFERDSLIKIRDEVMGKHITGSFGSNMSTAKVYVPDYKRIEYNGLFRAELRGLWEMTTDMMGGPFVMHAFVNENTGMVVVVETFVYAPEMKKRNLMRNLEAVLYTISIPEPDSVEVTA